METLILKFRNKRNYNLIKELASRLEGEKQNSSQRKKSQPKSKFVSDDDLRALGGIAKGQLISKEHLRNLSWKKRSW